MTRTDAFTPTKVDIANAVCTAKAAPHQPARITRLRSKCFPHDDGVLPPRIVALEVLDDGETRTQEEVERSDVGLRRDEAELSSTTPLGLLFRAGEQRPADAAPALRALDGNGIERCRGG